MRIPPFRDVCFDWDGFWSIERRVHGHEGRSCGGAVEAFKRAEEIIGYSGALWSAFLRLEEICRWSEKSLELARSRGDDASSLEEYVKTLAAVLSLFTSP